MPYLINESSADLNLYNDEKVNISQMDVDNSTLDSATEESYALFAKEAGTYAKKVKNNKIYDFKTKNKSFINTYNDLYKLGVKNNKFHLVLYDRDLQGVDPYSKVLPKDIQIKIFIETLINPWYFLREILRIPVDGMPIEIGGGVQYEIDRNNLACWYLFLNGIDHYQSKPRQRGKTQDCVAKFNYAYNFANLSSTALFFNKDQDQANMNLYRLKCQRDMFPSYLQMKFVVTDTGKVDKGIDNTKTIRNPVTGNTIMTMGKATSKESAMKLGRGATAALQYFDEFDFIPYQIEIMRAASFAYSTANANAIKYGSLSARILSSTPGDLDMRDGAEATKYIDKMLKWKDNMFDMDINKLKKIVNSPSYNRFVFVEHTWRQLKLSMAWYEKQCSLVSFDAETIMREIDLQRIHGSNNSPFSRAALLYIMKHKKEPITQIDYSKNLCPILIYEKLFINKPYILVVDPAEGLGQDNTAFTLINPASQKIAAEFESPYISQPDMFKLLCMFMDENAQACMIVIESNKGRELINYFLDSKYKDQLYYDDGKLNDKVIEKTDPYGRLKHEAMQRRAYGLWTGTNRSSYYAILENIMEERKELVFTQNLVKDVCGLIRQTNGKVLAGSGSHDDTVMAYLMGLFIYFNAPYEKLIEYGIKRGASDDIYDYDEQGNITEEGSLRQLADMMPSLPEEFRDIIANALNRKDPTIEAIENVEDIQYNIRNEYQQDGENRDIFTSVSPNNTNFWESFDSDVMRQNSGYGNDEFDIEDLF